MILDRIGYQKLFSLPNYENEKVIIEGQLEAGDDIQECLLQLKKQTEKFHKDNNPQLTEGGTVEWRDEFGPSGTFPKDSPFRTQPKIIPAIDRKAIDDLEIKIDDAKTQEELIALFPEVQKQGMEVYYLSKLKQFFPTTTPTN